MNLMGDVCCTDGIEEYMVIKNEPSSLKRLSGSFRQGKNPGLHVQV